MDTVGYATVLPMQQFEYYYSQHTRNMLKGTFCINHYYTADLIACSTCFGHHYAHHQELESIIQWFAAVELRVMCPVCRMLQHPVNQTHNPQLHTRTAT